MADLGLVIRHARLTGECPFYCTNYDFRDLVKTYNILMNNGKVEFHSRFVHDVFVDYGINVTGVAGNWVAYIGSFYLS